MGDNGIGARTHTGVVKDIKNIHTANHITINEVFAFSTAIHTAPNGNLSKINGKRAVGVIEQQLNFRHGNRLTGRRTSKNDIFHRLTTQILSVTFAKNP